jgi:glycosyltransferase involved in cell wall biosynthesis
MILYRLGLQPVELVKTLAILPKTIYFSSIAQRDGCQRVHAHFVNVPTMAATIMSCILNIPFSCTGHGSDLFEYPPLDLKRRIHDASPFITISNFNKEHLSRQYEVDKDSIQVVHCGIDLSGYEHQNKKIPSNRPINILTVARLENVKGIDIVLQASRLLLDRDVEFYWSIIGDGSQRKNLMDLHENLHLGPAVKLLGVLPHHEVIRFFEQADLFVLTSRREGIPVSLMESMASGVPSIAPYVTGIPELVDNGVSGLLIQKVEPQTVCNAIITLMSDPVAYQNYSKNSRAKIDLEFDGKKNSAKLMQLWMR